MIVEKIERKGVVNVIELVIVMLTLLVSFNIFFPESKYENRWEDAYGVLMSRDTVLTLERIGKLHEYAFDSSKMDQFLDELFPKADLILWYDVTGGIKSEINVACNCSQEMIENLDGWFDGIELNDRTIDLKFCYTDMGQGDACMLNSNVLLILGDYIPLEEYKASLDVYVENGNGIIEVIDFEEEQDVEADSVQTDIFGLKWISTEKSQFDYSVFSRTPGTADDEIFILYKYFYRIPMPIKATLNGGFIDGCDVETKKGFLEIRGEDYGFWICGSDSVFFDTDGDGNPNQQKMEMESLNIGGYTFYLNYIENNQIKLSFRPSYRFSDFLSYIFPGGLGDNPPEGGGLWRTVHIEPRDDDADRVLIKSIESGTTNEYPAIIINNIGTTNLAWAAYLGDSGYGDDEKTLLLSLILWASNKENTGTDLSNVKLGYKTTYIKISNRDMFEIYKFNLGVGYPF